MAFCFRGKIAGHGVEYQKAFPYETVYPADLRTAQACYLFLASP